MATKKQAHKQSEEISAAGTPQGKVPNKGGAEASRPAPQSEPVLLKVAAASKKPTPAPPPSDPLKEKTVPPKPAAKSARAKKEADVNAKKPATPPPAPREAAVAKTPPTTPKKTAVPQAAAAPEPPAVPAKKPVVKPIAKVAPPKPTAIQPTAKPEAKAPPAPKAAAPKPVAPKPSAPSPARRTTTAAKQRAAASAEPEREAKRVSPPAHAEPQPPAHREAMNLSGSTPAALVMVEQAQAYGEPSAEAANFPAMTGQTHLVLMARDPEWLYAYWELTPEDREQHRIGLPQGAPPLLMRIFDLGDGLEPLRTESHFDVTVIADVTGWYVHVPRASGHWSAALGYLNAQANLTTLCESNVVTTSAGAPLPEQGWEPTATTGAEVVRLGTTVGTRELTAHEAQGAPTQAPHNGKQTTAPWLASVQAGLRPGSSAQVGLLRPGASEQVVQLRPGASEQVVQLRPGASEQMAFPGSGIAGEQRGAAVEVPKGFWLQVHTELIVYGATEPDARVTVQGNPIRLRPDGTFTLRFALPDSEQVIPVRAVSVDGDFERVITPIVSKQTK